MIYLIDDLADSGIAFVVMPNQAMSWRALIWVFGGIATVTMAVGIYFYLLGFPLVLPFSGLEILALGLALYVTAWRGGAREVVTFKTDRVTIEKGRSSPEVCFEFQRSLARIILEHSWNSWYPSRLFIRSHGRQVEIGRFLNEQERQGLAKELRRAL
jgi:uncharacterized membrane protein